MDYPTYLFGDLIVNVITTGSSTRLEMGTHGVSAAQKRQPQLLPSQARMIPFEGFLPPLRNMEAAADSSMADAAIKPQAQSAVCLGIESALPPFPSHDPVHSLIKRSGRSANSWRSLS